MRRRHAMLPAFSGHYQDLGISSLKGYASALQLYSYSVVIRARADRDYEQVQFHHVLAVRLQRGREDFHRPQASQTTGRHPQRKRAQETVLRPAGTSLSPPLGAWVL